MNKLNIIIHTLYLLRSSVGRTLTINEDKILGEYRKPAQGKSGIAIKALSVFGGFAASLFFLAFLFLAGLYNSEKGMLIFGLIFIAAAIIVNRKFDSLVVDTVSISFFLMGFVLSGIGLGSLKVNENMICLVFIAFALFTLFIIQNYIFSFISLLIINGSLLALILFSRSNNWIHLLLIVQVIAIVYLFLHEAAFISARSKISRLYPPIRSGMVFSFLCGLVLVARRDLISTGPYYLLATSIVIIVALLYVAFRLMPVLNVTQSNDKLLIFGIASLMFVPTILAPAISGCVLVILLSFFVRHRGGFILGIISLLYFISQYYYDLEYTLLQKSYFLIGSGILFILIYLVTVKKLARHAKA